MANATPETPEVDGHKRGTRWTFVIAAIIIAIACILRKPLGIADVRHAHPWAVFWYSFFALLFLNLFDFVVTLFAAFRVAHDVAASAQPDEQKERQVEAILVPAMQGQLPPPPIVWRIIRYPVALCFGSMVGAVVGWALTAVIGLL